MERIRKSIVVFLLLVFAVPFWSVDRGLAQPLTVTPGNSPVIKGKFRDPENVKKARCVSKADRKARAAKARAAGTLPRAKAKGGTDQ